MANWYSTEYTNAFETVPYVVNDVSKWGGRVRCMFSSFALTGALATSDKIYMGQIPPGAYIYSVILASTDLDSSTNALLAVGYEYNGADDLKAGVLSNSTNAFLSSVNVQSAITSSMSGNNNAAGFGYQAAGIDPMDIVVNVTVAGDATTGTIKLLVEYAVD